MVVVGVVVVVVEVVVVVVIVELIVVVVVVMGFLVVTGRGQVSFIFSKIQSRAILVLIRLPSNIALKCWTSSSRSPPWQWSEAVESWITTRSRISLKPPQLILDTTEDSCYCHFIYPL